MGHVFNDVNQSVVPALLPFLVTEYGLSYAAAAGLVLALSIANSVVQPLFGHWADRGSLPWLLPGGITLGALGVSALTRVPSYPLMILVAVIAGVGIAAFHPEAARFANFVSRDRRATGMGLFNLGGNVGFALGPILVTPLLLAFGLHGATWVAVPGLIVSLFLLRSLPYLERFRPSEAKVRATRAASTDEWGPFALLTALIVLRSMAFFTMLTFVPLFLIHELGVTNAQGNAGLALMLVCGAIGTAAGGPLGDRFNRRAIIIVTLIGVALFGAALTWAGTHHQLALAFLFIALTGALTSMSSGITAVMGQDYLPARIGTASGVTLGLSISLGGVAAPILGALADHYGLAVAIAAVSVVALLSLACAIVLPPPAITRARSAQPGEAQSRQGGVGDDAHAGREVEAADEAVAHRDAQHAAAVARSS